MTAAQKDLAERFASLHRRGDPLVLVNIWDPGSARIVAAAGAAALATGSWSVAAAFGHDDGERLPRALAIDNLARIAAAVPLPVSVDLEGGYGEDPAAVAETVGLAVDAGAVGINFEDQLVGGEGLHPVDRQQARLRAVRRVAQAKGIPLFVNARTDLFLAAGREEHERLVDPALERARFYAEAGADGLFVPGLADEGLIARVCARSPLPVNVMWMQGMDRGRLAALGVARISHGPGPYRHAMAALRTLAEEAYS